MTAAPPLAPPHSPPPPSPPHSPSPSASCPSSQAKTLLPTQPILRFWIASLSRQCSASPYRWGTDGSAMHCSGCCKWEGSWVWGFGVTAVISPGISGKGWVGREWVGIGLVMGSLWLGSRTIDCVASPALEVRRVAFKIINKFGFLFDNTKISQSIFI